MLRVALTGGIATGKSYVLERFRQHGIPCLDADVLAHGVTAAGTEAARAIAVRFGPEIIGSDGSVDRKTLGGIVFADDRARRDLEAIVHPAVYRAITAGLRAFELIGGSPIAVADVPLLFETDHRSDFDAVVVTACSEDLQLSRLTARGLSTTEARQRIASQLPTAKKVPLADYVVRTDGTFPETDRQVEQILNDLRARAT